jgi:hypothetical protein
MLTNTSPSCVHANKLNSTLSFTGYGRLVTLLVIASSKLHIRSRLPFISFTNAYAFSLGLLDQVNACNVQPLKGKTRISILLTYASGNASALLTAIAIGTSHNPTRAIAAPMLRDAF